MRKFKMAAAVLGVLGVLSMPVLADVTKEDLKKLTSAGISEEVILSYVKANGPMAKLSAQDLIDLKQAGASEKLLASVLAVSTAPVGPAAPQDTRRSVVGGQVYPPTTVPYVYDSTPYYYTPSTVYYSSSSPGYYYPRSYYSPSYSYSTWPSHHSHASVSIHPSVVHNSVHSSGHYSSHSSGHSGSHTSGHRGHR